MRPGARVFLDLLKFVFTLGKAGRKIAENRRAVKHGKPKPHDPMDIAGDFQDMTSEAVDDFETAKERPSVKR